MAKIAKIDVTLRCQLDNGKTVLHPGEVVKMDEKEAMSLAGLGLVELPGPAPKPPRNAARQEPEGRVPEDDPDTEDSGGDFPGDPDEDAA
jgi:hypothetical protein